MNPKPSFLLLFALLHPLLSQAAGEPFAVSPGSDPEVAVLAAKASPLQTLDQFPVPRHIVPPVCSDGWGPLNDRVVVEFFIDEQGQVSHPHAVEGKNAALREASVAAVAQWLFGSPMLHGVPTIVIARQVFAFAPKSDSSGQTGVTIPGSWGPAAGADSHSPAIYNLSNLNQVPKAISQVPPKYPPELRKAGITGQVVVDFVVAADGTVINAYAASSTREEFEQAAVSAVSQWKFKPGLIAGRPVNVHLKVPIVFALPKK